MTHEGLVVRLPLKIGDTAWGIRTCYNTKRVLCGKVSEICFNKDMELIFAVKRLSRGKLGERVFLTKEEAEQALKKIGE